MINRHLRRVAALGSVSVTATGIATAIWYRPIPDSKEDFLGPKREKYMFISRLSLADTADSNPPFTFKVANQVLTFATVSFCRLFFMTFGSFMVKHDGNYFRFLSLVRDRDTGEPLITVSNHRSMLDDPGMMSCLLPYSMSICPKYLRYSVCAQEYCFSKKLPDFCYGICGALHVLPIWRGGGINQKLFLDFARHGTGFYRFDIMFAQRSLPCMTKHAQRMYAAAGKWLHLFPEGAIWQYDNRLGGRSNGREDVQGKLKWGVGKLIAHAPYRPRVVPFFHMGMEYVLPQNNETKELLGPPIPCMGTKVHVLFGSELFFDDLIADHERIHGPLWKYTASVYKDMPSSRYLGSSNASGASREPASLPTTGGLAEGRKSTHTSNVDNAQNEEEMVEDTRDFHRHWDSSEAEKLLYHRITLRIQHAFEELQTQHHKEITGP